jgi:hypothetical protein
MIGDGLRPANAEISFVLTEGCRDSTEYVRRHGDGGTEARNLEAAGIEIPKGLNPRAVRLDGVTNTEMDDAAHPTG